MPRTAITVQPVTDAGVAINFVAANVAGNMVPAGSLLVVKNGSGAPINVTLTTPKTYQGKAIADPVIAVAAGAETAIGGLTQDLYAQPSGTDEGQVYVDYSAVTTVTVAALRT